MSSNEMQVVSSTQAETESSPELQLIVVLNRVGAPLYASNMDEIYCSVALTIDGVRVRSDSNNIFTYVQQRNKQNSPLQSNRLK